MNMIIGKSKTVHNAQAVNLAGESIPTCSVGTYGKTVVETDAAVTCKTCLKATPAPVCECAAAYLGHTAHTAGCPLDNSPARKGPTHNPAACAVRNCTMDAA